MTKFDQLYSTIHAFKIEKDNHDPVFLEKLAKELMKVVTERTGQYLHKLHKKQPEKDIVKKMIDAVPSALSYEDIFKDFHLPICSFLGGHIESIPYIPLLAKEGVKHKVGGDGARGGLLLGIFGDDYDRNVLQALINRGTKGPTRNKVLFDNAMLNAMKELREAKLLRKEDIDEYSLLYWTCRRKCQLRFEFLLDWVSEGLKLHRHEGKPIIHAIIKNEKLSIKHFATFFENALKRHPNELGLLFQKDDRGKTACERAFKRYGREATFKIIGDYIPSDSTEFPILHHVVENAPQYINQFAMRYQSAGFLRDSKGRTLCQAEIASGSKRFTNDAAFFVRMSDEQVREIDPGTDLYPFVVLASGETNALYPFAVLSSDETTSDLSAVYYMLRRNPSLVNSGIKRCSITGRKRKRNETTLDLQK